MDNAACRLGNLRQELVLYDLSQLPVALAQALDALVVLRLHLHHSHVAQFQELRVLTRLQFLCDPWGCWGVGGDGANGAPNVSEFWKVVDGLQLLAARDGQSPGHVGGAGGDTELRAVLGSGNAKEASETAQDMAVEDGRRGGLWVREAYK